MKSSKMRKTTNSPKTPSPKSTPARPQKSSTTVSPLEKIRRFLLYLLIPSLFFSYHPIISLGSNDSMNLELSLPLILLALFSVLSLPTLYRRFPKKTAFLLFPAFTTISVFWSKNPLRTILTSGILACLIISILTIPKLISSENIKLKIVKIYLCSTALICLFCWLQCFLDLAGLDRCQTLMCEGCTYRAFGFPHPNGFAIEPQFMGNLLLAPAILSLFYLCHHHKTIINFLGSFLVIATLFLTFSRGAIYAFLIAALLIFLYELISSRKSPLLVVLAVIVPLLSSVAAQGLMASLSPTSDTFKTGVAKSISQLTLGKIELFKAERAAVQESDLKKALSPDIVIENPTDAALSGETATEAESAIFSGYVAESTNRRVELTEKALDLWNDRPETVFFGVGLGSAGPRLFEKFENLGSPKEIVQNEYASILLETGLIGSLFCIIMIIYYLRYLRLLTPSPYSRHIRAKTLPQKIQNTFNSLTPTRAYLAALLISYAVTLFFFSGLPNALHIYLLPVILAVIL